MAGRHSISVFHLRAAIFRRIATAVWAVAGLIAVVAATTVIPPDLPQLANESDYVIRAVVTSVNSEFSERADGRVIVTKIGLEVRDVIAGKPPATVVLEMLGGRVGTQEMTVEGAPKFKVGDEDVLFVKNNGRAICPLLAMMHGRYPILRDTASGREYVARSNRVPLTDPAQISLPMAQGAAAEMQRRLADSAAAVTPAEFARQIRSAVDSSYSRARQN